MPEPPNSPVLPSASEDPAVWKFGFPIHHVETRAQWRTWLDHDRGMQLITPRKAKSAWSRLNRQRAADMEPTGAMTVAGRQAIGGARGNGWWTISDPVEDLIEPTDLAAALDANPAARAEWDGFSPGERKIMLWWVVSAARQSTKDTRILRIVEDAALGRRARN